MTLEQAFKKIITTEKKPEWITKQNWYLLKRYYKNKKISVKQMEKIVRKFNYIKVQEEIWKLNK